LPKSVTMGQAITDKINGIIIVSPLLYHMFPLWHKG